jgi:DNA-binding response OmpR family regulator
MTNLTALVVDHSTSYTHSIASSLKSLGCAEEHIYIAKRYEEARNIIQSKRPDILITEASLNGRHGLELVGLMNSQSANKISVIISHSNSGPAIAEAAEELVDDYIVKPFQGGQFAERLRGIISRKVNPSDYIKSIRTGKQFLIEGKLQEAETQFRSAMGLDNKPTLAHYYLGYAKFIQNNYQPAVNEFKKGLDLQPLHFKCLTGNFDAFFEQKSFAAAYNLAPMIIENYPIGPKRLANLFISAVFSGHLEEIPKYYGRFLNLDNVTPELRKVFSAALLAAGRFHIHRQEVDKAAECFDLGVQVMGPEVEYIDKAIRALLNTKERGPHLAAKLLQRFPNAKIGGKEHSALVFLTAVKSQHKSEAFELGRKLVTNGYADGECYEALVKLLVEDGKHTLAEDVVAKAVRDYPALRKTLYDVLEKGGTP